MPLAKGELEIHYKVMHNCRNPLAYILNHRHNKQKQITIKLVVILHTTASCMYSKVLCLKFAIFVTRFTLRTSL